MNTPLSGQPAAASLSVMGPKQRVRTISDDTDDQEHLAVRLIELLNDDQVLAKLKKVLFPTELYEKMDALYEQVRRLHAQVFIITTILYNYVLIACAGNTTLQLYTFLITFCPRMMTTHVRAVYQQ